MNDFNNNTHEIISVLQEKYTYLKDKVDDLHDIVEDHENILKSHSSLLHSVRDQFKQLEQDLTYNLADAKEERLYIKDTLERIENEAINSVPKEVTVKLDNLHAKGGIYRTLFIAAITICAALVGGIFLLLTGLIPH